MLGAIGIVLVFALVFGGYLASGGKMEIILKALPYEMTMIGGAAVGAFLISNSGDTVKHTLHDIKKVFKGSKWSKDDFTSALCLLSELVKLYRNSPVELEPHLEDPSSSQIFQKYEKVASDQKFIDLICDTFRSATLNFDEPTQVEDLIDKRLNNQTKSSLHSSHALQTMADGLPALGIVAAVLGVIKTMASIDQPPEILGKMIGGALVGTFLGVFLAYGVVGPFATRLKSIADEESEFYFAMREVVIACLQNHPPQLCLEAGRQFISEQHRPSFNELEDALRSGVA